MSDTQNDEALDTVENEAMETAISICRFVEKCGGPKMRPVFAGNIRVNKEAETEIKTTKQGD